MRTLIIGGTGLISVGIVKHLLARGADVVMFNRGNRSDRAAERVKQIPGDRNDFQAFENRFKTEKFDAVIDMIAFSPAQAESAVRAFAGRCAHFLFCSTVCVYGIKVPPGVLVDESFPPSPTSNYGRNKLAAEKIFLDAHSRGDFHATIVRPSNTYGPGNSLIDQLEPNPVAWDRISRGLPVLITGDGLGLWNSTHRDDVGKFFAHACLNPKTFGQSYNTTTQTVFTWRDYYQTVAEVLGRPARLLSVPADLVVAQDPARFNLLAEITRHHGAYTSAAAMRDVPEFHCEIDFATGARQTLEDLRRRNAWRTSDDDAVYESIVKAAMEMGIEPLDLHP